MPTNTLSVVTLPPASSALVTFGFKYSAGGPHISRTMMLAELETVLSVVPVGAGPAEYHDAIVERNVLGKDTVSTRKESVRRLRELYALNEAKPVFHLLRTLHTIDPAALPLLALQVVWARDPLFRATTLPVLNAPEGERVETLSLEQALEAAFPQQYSKTSFAQTARHAASSWTQSGHLSGRAHKTRRLVKPSSVPVTMALFLGTLTGFHGASVFTNPWCALLDLNADRARLMGSEAHRAGLVNLRMVGEVVELSFPLFVELQPSTP